MTDKVSQGQPFKPSARVWNSLQEAAEWYHNTKRLADSRGIKPATPHEPDVIQCSNSTGANRSRGDVVMIGDKLLTDLEKLHPWFDAVEYDDTQTLHSFGFCADPIADGAIGPVIISGGCIATIDVQDASHRFAKPVNGSYALESTASGPVEIVYKPSGTGTKTCFVVFPVGGGKPIEFIELTEKLALGGTAAAVVLEWNDEAHGYDATGETIIVQDFFKDPDGLHNPGDLIGAPGYRGWAKRPTTEVATISSTEHPAWPLIRLEQVAEVIRFTLNTAMSGGSSANATVNYYYDGRSPGTYQTIYDPLGLFAGAPAGATGIARRNNRTGDGSPAASDVPEGRYEVVECSSNAGVVFFTLTQARSFASTPVPEESRNATRNHHCGSQQDTISPGNVAVWFREGWFPHALIGAKGVAVYDVTADKYWVVQCDQMAKRIRGTLYSDFCPPSHATASAFSVMDFHPHSQTPDAAHIGTANYTIYNYGTFAGLTGDAWEATWDDSRSKFVLTWVAPHSISVVTDYKMEKESPGDDCPKLYLKKRQIYAHTCATAEAWEIAAWQPTTIDLLSEVKNVYTAASGGNPATCVMKQEYRKLMVLAECDNPTSDATVFSWVSQDVMVNAYDGTSEITGVTQAIWVGPCTMPATEEFTIIDITDCP